MFYKNRIHYLFLFAGLFIGLAFFFNFFGFPGLQVETVVGLCLYYFFWGIVHHWLKKDLHVKIVLEYFLVSVIACALLLSLIWRAQPAVFKKFF